MAEVQTLITRTSDLTAEDLKTLLASGYEPNPPGLLLWARVAPPEVIDAPQPAQDPESWPEAQGVPV